MLVGKLTGTGSLRGTLSGTGSLRGTLSGGGVGHGIPSGGEPGQGLIKVSDTDYDVKWMSILPEDTASGSVASFPDGADDLPIGVVVDIDPVQDLHGYDNPWPGGGGVNILPITMADTVTSNGVTFTVNKDDSGNVLSISTSGTATATIVRHISSGLSIVATDRNLYLRGCPSGGSASSYYMTARTSGQWLSSYDTGSGVGLYGTVDVVAIVIQSGVNTDGLVFKPMIAVQSQTDYAPYSNICPISGWTGAKVTRTGRNLLPTQNTVTTGNTTYIGGADYWIRLKAGTYTMSEEGAPAYLYWRKEGTTDNNIIHSSISHSGTFTLLEDCNVRFWCYGTQGTNYSSIQLETGSTAHAYEPYTAVTHEIPFSTEVYGGTLNVETGELVVDRAMYIPTGNEVSYVQQTQRIAFALPTGYRVPGSVYRVCSTFQVQTSSTYCYVYTDLSIDELKSYFQQNDVQIVVGLATPITIQLTPVEIRSLLGDNNVWSDTGDVSVTYLADVQKYIDKKISAAVAAMS